MNGHRAKWLGKRSFFQVDWRFGAYLYKALVSLYLFYSALFAIADFTGANTLILVLVWFVLVTPLPVNGKTETILTSEQRRYMNWALVLGGTAYRIGGHPSGLMVLALIVYWAIIVAGQERHTGLRD